MIMCVLKLCAWNTTMYTAIADFSRLTKKKTSSWHIAMGKDERILRASHLLSTRDYIGKSYHYIDENSPLLLLLLTWPI